MYPLCYTASEKIVTVFPLCPVLHGLLMPIHTNINSLIVIVEQGDVCDSSDEEWDQHIGRNARAFMGLNEPVAEIALDEGVGMGTMVRNAFACADDIHMQASLSGCSRISPKSRLCRGESSNSKGG
jgi:hypothetical protein